MESGSVKISDIFMHKNVIMKKTFYPIFKIKFFKH